MLYRNGNWDKVILVKIIFFLIPIHKLRLGLRITLLMGITLVGLLYSLLKMLLRIFMLLDYCMDFLEIVLLFYP